MPVSVIVGVQWGDEGKGKVVDFLADNADIVARYQGGSNAGHTVKIGKEEYKLHLVPSGALYGKTCVIGNDVVVDTGILLSEVEGLAKRGKKFKLLVSDRAHVVTPYHKQVDAAEEANKGKRGVGTTKRGIGPAYTDKASRIGIRVSDLYEPDTLHDKLEESVRINEAYMRALGGKEVIDAKAAARQLESHAEKMRGMVADTAVFLNDATDDGKDVLLEGAQGTLLDLDFGTYPYVTSSNTTASGACTGTGLPPSKIDRVVGVMKAYTTRVGAGPFPTELDIERGEGHHLSTAGREVGTTTGRSRRCGWLDLVVAKHAVRLSGIDALAVMKLDILTGLDPVRVCVAYDIDGREVTNVPASLSQLSRAKPVYEEFKGWTALPNAFDPKKGLGALPREAQKYLEAVTSRLKVGLSLVSTGPERSETLRL